VHAFHMDLLHWIQTHIRRQNDTDYSEPWERKKKRRKSNEVREKLLVCENAIHSITEEKWRLEPEHRGRLY